MKRIFISLLASLGLAASAQSPALQAPPPLTPARDATKLDSARELGLRDLRIINGALYDFGMAPASCTVSGTVKAISGNTVILSNVETKMEVGAVPNDESGTSGLLRGLAISRLGNSPGQRLSMGASVRYVTVEYQTEVANLNNVTIGQKVAVQALLLDPKNPKWDAGTRFTGDVHEFKTVYRFAGNRIVANPIPPREQIEAKAAKRNQAAIDSLTRNATKGLAFAEYELGLRYLKGDGVEVDPAKAKEWLQKAAAQGYAKAKAALQSLPSPQPTAK